MEKRKLKKLRINRIKDEFPLIGDSEQLQLKGGDDTIYYGGMLPEVTVYGYPNDGSYHVGESVKCEKCKRMNPDIDKGLYSIDDVYEGVAAHNLATSIYHWLDKKR